MNGPWSESRDAGNPHVRFDERDLETERHERHRARSRLYQAKALDLVADFGVSSVEGYAALGAMQANNER